MSLVDAFSTLNPKPHTFARLRRKAASVRKALRDVWANERVRLGTAFFLGAHTHDYESAEKWWELIESLISFI